MNRLLAGVNSIDQCNTPFVWSMTWRGRVWHDTADMTGLMRRRQNVGVVGATKIHRCNASAIGIDDI